MSRLEEFRAHKFTFPDSLNLFEGQQDICSTVRKDFGHHGKLVLERSRPKDCIEFSTEKLEGSTTIGDAYRPYSGKNYIPTGTTSNRLPTAGKIIRTTKAVHIPARPRTQMRISRQKLENITSYSYQYSGEKSEKSEPFRPKSELEGPCGDLDLTSTNKDYAKFDYGRPLINYIPDTGLFENKSYMEGTTSEQHFSAPPPTKEGNLRPKTGIILGEEKFVPKSSYRKQFDKVKDIYG